MSLSIAPALVTAQRRPGCPSRPSAPGWLVSSGTTPPPKNVLPRQRRRSRPPRRSLQVPRRRCRRAGRGHEVEDGTAAGPELSCSPWLQCGGGGVVVGRPCGRQWRQRQLRPTLRARARGARLGCGLRTSGADLPREARFGGAPRSPKFGGR